MPSPTDAHFGTLANRLLRGRVVPFFGAGVNLCERAPEHVWQPGVDLPSGSELARHLYEYMREQGHEVPSRFADDLVRISQYVAVMVGDGPLYEELHRLFGAPYPTTILHRLFADLAAPDVWGRPQLVVTTNYDDLLERAYEERGVAFDVLTYVAEGPNRGRFVHAPPDGPSRVIERPNEFDGLRLNEDRHLVRPAILKIHGAVSPNDEQDSYVITEDDYIYYLTLPDLIPTQVQEQLKRSHFLFLGYGLRDWNLRVLLRRVWGQQYLSYPSWAVQLDPSDLDTRFWAQRDVEIIEQDLGEYVRRLRTALEAASP